MRISDGITLLEVNEVVTVFSARGRFFHMDNRPCYGLSLCRGGKITYVHNGRTCVSDPSCAVLLPMGATYDLHGNATGAFPHVNFTADGFGLREFVALPLSNPGLCLHAYESLFHAYAYEKNRLKVMRCAYELLEQVQSGADDRFDILRPAELFLNGHMFDADLRNDDIAAAAGISEVYLRRLFVKKYGITPHKYILRARIEKAKEELSGTRDSVGAVAARCGFPDMFHFCRVFRETVGSTPTDYRRIARKI